MTLPISSTIETPILQELKAVAGMDDVRFLYERLFGYFPQLSEREIAEIKSGENNSWRKAVQKAGKMLDDKGFISRSHGLWTITEKGSASIESETSGFTLTKLQNAELNHQDIQQMLVEIAESLGFYAEKEFEYYDVIWRDNRTSSRISHVFEVQSKGNIDSAFAKLKRAFDAQRSKPFLILSSERDTNRAQKSLAQEFRELEKFITILSFAQLRKIHENLSAISDFLPNFLHV